MNKICEYCNKEIRHINKNQKYHKECAKEKRRKQSRKWNRENLEKAREKIRKWKLNNPKRYKQAKERWRKNNLEKARITQRTYNQTEKAKATKKRYLQSEKGKETMIKAQRRHYHNNREKILKKNKLRKNNWDRLSDQEQLRLINKKANELLKNE